MSDNATDPNSPDFGFTNPAPAPESSGGISLARPPLEPVIHHEYVEVMTGQVPVTVQPDDPEPEETEEPGDDAAEEVQPG